MIQHKINKLLSMGKDELFFRVKESVIQQVEYSLHKLGKDQVSNKKFETKVVQNHSTKPFNTFLLKEFFNGNRDIFFTELYDKKDRVYEFKKYCDTDKWIVEAKDILEGKITLLGKKLNLPVDQGWHVDPLNKVKWAQIFFSKVSNSANTKSCDIKYIWEINRHQYLISLGKAYWLTGDEKYSERVFATISGWISENPYNSGVNWTSSLELAVRTISWIWAYFLCQGSKYLTAPFHQIFVRSVYEQAKHIESHLSYYSSPYNHLIGEAAALHIIGTLFSQLKQAEKWESLGWSILEQNIDKQFHPDGFCVEQASFYHHFTLGFYLQSVLLRKMNSKNVAEKVLKRVEKALEFSMFMTKPDGTLPMVGDIDNARSLYFSPLHAWNFKGYLGIGAVLYNRSDFKKQCNNSLEEILWLFSDSEIDKYTLLNEKQPNAISKIFQKSGYCISRDSWDHDSNYLCFDCGEIADGLSDKAIPSAAHGHADGLSFDLSAYGKSYIIDAGFYTYFGDLDWHKHFRHEEAHNTLLIENYRQAEYCGRLTWQKVKSPELLQCEHTEKYDYFAGRIQFNTDVSHKRQIVYLKDQCWMFNDTITTDNKDTKVDTFINFAPGVEIKIDKIQKQITASIGEEGIILQYFNDSEILVTKGGRSPSDGWVASGYGIKKPGCHIQFRWNTAGKRCIFPFLIIPCKKNKGFLCKKYELNTKSSNIFKSEFLINKNNIKIIIDEESKISLIHDSVNYQFD
ncbi:MAG: alginate lyase family protein [Deltaproteobacteria bacterium]|jgi:hypothetical protein|nr:alginate lyase family protein [Deltaproteobacteria bacterium]